MNFLIETKRLIIRPARESDFPIFNKALKNLLPPQTEFDQPDTELFQNQDLFLDLIRKNRKKAELGITLNFFAFLKDEPVLIGDTQFWCIQRDNAQRATLGYSVLNNFWRRGFAFEIATAMIDFGINTLQLQRIEAEILPENSPSIALCEKLGMKFECVKRKSLFENNQWKDHVIYSVIAQDLGIENRAPGNSFPSII